MNILIADHRYLENKFAKHINKHLFKALPYLAKEKYVQMQMSNDYEDTQLSFDMLFGLKFQVSIRIRKNKYLKYKDITLRYKSKMGKECEIDKIKKGYGQVYFYAYMNEEETDLVKVRIIDVDVLREMIYNENYIVRKNNDETELAAFSFQSIAENGGGLYKFG